MQKIDEGFYQRVDAHINLSNSQISKKIGKGKVSSSTMYAAARFSSWVSACGWDSGKEMAEAKLETISYFTNEFSKMLEENLDDYIENFDSYTRILSGNEN